MSGYRRGGYRRNYAPSSGRVTKANARPGPCHYCGEIVAANAGQLWRDDNGWSAVHLEATWQGSPVSGSWAGGCPESASISMSAAQAERDARPVPAPLAVLRAYNAVHPAIVAVEAPRDSRGGYADECGSCGMASCSC